MELNGLSNYSEGILSWIWLLTEDTVAEKVFMILSTVDLLMFRFPAI